MTNLIKIKDKKRHMKNFVFYTQGIEYKSFFDEKSKEQRYFVKGHIDSSDIDLVNDIVTKSCIDDLHSQLKSRSIKLDFDHETLRKGKGESELDAQLNLARIPLGKAISTDVDEKGNLVEFELNPHWKKFDSKGNVVMTFDEVWSNIKSGFYDSFSIAYVPVKTQQKSVDGVLARMLDKINLINVALTGNPINPNATMTSVFAKSLEYVSEFEELKSEISELKKLVGDNMTEKKSEEVQQETVEAQDVPKEKEVVAEAQEEVKEETQEVQEAKTEEKSVEYVDTKSFAELKSKIDAFEKSLSKIEETLSKAVVKSTGAENKSAKAEAVKTDSSAVLDLI